MNKYVQNAAVERIAPDQHPVARTAMLPYAHRLVPIFIAGALFVLAVVYLIQLNVVAAKGFALKTTERRVAELAEQHKKLQVELAQKESLTGLTEGVSALGLVPVKQVEYIRSSADPVAVR